MRILLIEDDRRLSKLIRQVLEDEGFAVDVAYDGAFQGGCPPEPGALLGNLAAAAGTGLYESCPTAAVRVRRVESAAWSLSPARPRGPLARSQNTRRGFDFGQAAGPDRT